MFKKIYIFIQKLSEREILFILIIITFSLRLYAVLMAKGIANDSAAYGFMARDFMKGNFEKALSSPLHPFYPVLMALFSPTPSHVEITGRLISLFFGTLTLFIIFNIVKKEIGEREAFLTALFYTFHPYLVTYSGMMLTEATYWGLLVLSVYFFWTGLKEENIWKMAPAGIFLGLSYLTRPEGIGYIFVYFIWIFLNIFQKKSWLKGVFQIIALVLFVFLFSFPYIFYIYKETGQWLISKKALSVQSLFLEKDFEKNVNGVEPLQNPVKDDQKIIKESEFLLIFKNIINFFPSVFYYYLRAYHFSLWIFLFFGLMGIKKNLYNELFFISLIIFHLLFLSIFTKSNIRFSIPMISISLYWAGRGVLEIEKLFKKINSSKAVVWVSTLTLIVLLIQLPQSLKPERRHRYYQKEIGLWLKKNTTKDSIIMSNSPQEIFYAEREFIMLPYESRKPKSPIDSYNEVIRFARENRVKYILIDKNSFEINKGFVDVIVNKKFNFTEDIKEVFRKPEQKLIIYEIIY